MNNQEETKLIKVLEFFLSLHEADLIYNAIFDEKVTLTELDTLLKNFRKDFNND